MNTSWKRRPRDGGSDLIAEHRICYALGEGKSAVANVDCGGNIRQVGISHSRTGRPLHSQKSKCVTEPSGVLSIMVLICRMIALEQEKGGWRPLLVVHVCAAISS